MELCLINGKAYFLTAYGLEKAQLWKEGSGRNPNDGEWYGSLLGNFTNLELEVFIVDQEQMQALETDLLSGDILVQFYDTRTDSERTANFYRANYKIKIDGFYDEGTQLFYDKVKLNFVGKSPE